jgi:hypothetical protein
MLGDIAFVPIEVLLVTLIIHQVLNLREKQIMLNKLNMVIGAFFSEVGTKLLQRSFEFDSQLEKICGNLLIGGDWLDKRFAQTQKDLTGYDYRIDAQKGNLKTLKKFLVKKRDFLLRLLENPNLLEHESFTELLWAVFHLTEELGSRTSVEQLPPANLEHLANDIKRAYTLLLSEWVEYMKHLKNKYLYLFSLAVRTNPFNPQAAVEIQGG